MGLFGDLDVSSAEDNPWMVPANTYEADLYEVEVKPNKLGTKTNLVLTYKIASGDHMGKTVTEYKQVPNPADPNNPTPEEKKAASYIKQRLSTLGVPESRMNTVEVNDLVGTPVTIKVTVDGEYTNVARVELRGENAAIETQEFKGFTG